MEAQVYVSKIVQIEKVNRAMVTKLKVIKYLERLLMSDDPSPVRHFIAHPDRLYRPERLFRSVLAASFEPSGK
jgi:hypothetical protein